MNANSITFNSFSESYFGRPVLQSFLSATYFLRSICSMTSLKVYTGSEISMILSISTGNFSWIGVLYFTVFGFFMVVKS